MPKDDNPVLKPFNPLDKRNLGESVAEALLQVEAQPLPPKQFIGAGVYAIYYAGSFSAYARLSELGPSFCNRARIPQSSWRNGLKNTWAIR